jgi:hypothetical protein
MADLLRGIDDKRRLLGFFGTKGHHNLVLRVCDLIELPLPSQAELVTVLRVYGGLAPFDNGREPRDFFMHHSFDGYVIVPFDQLLQADLPVLQEVQQILSEYHDIRHGKGEPSRVDVCEGCHGRGCKKCGGVGKITTYLEMSEAERQLAEVKR